MDEPWKPDTKWKNLDQKKKIASFITPFQWNVQNSESYAQLMHNLYA